MLTQSIELQTVLLNRQGITFVWKAINRTGNRGVRYIPVEILESFISNTHHTYKTRSNNLRKVRKEVGKKEENEGRGERENKEEMEGEMSLYFRAYAKISEQPAHFLGPSSLCLRPLTVGNDSTISVSSSQIPSSFEEDSIAIAEHHFWMFWEVFSAGWEKMKLIGALWFPEFFSGLQPPNFRA